MEENRGLIEDILVRGYLMSIGTTDANGVWVTDLIYVYDDDFNIYWISQINSRHSTAVIEHDEVVVSISVSNQDEPYKGMQIQGIVERVDHVDFSLLKQRLEKHNKRIPYVEKPFFEDGKFPSNELSWYKLTPQRIEIIQEKYLGFEKKIIDTIV